MAPPAPIRRRTFLTGSAAAMATPLRWARGASPSMVYRPFGGTDLRVSEIGFGAYGTRDPDVIRYALDRGINYFDTAWDYMGGLSEETLGEALAGRRDEAVITTKWHPWPDTTKAEMLEMLHTSLRRLRTDHVDALLVHSVGAKAGKPDGIPRLQNPELFEAIEQARKDGKARFFGCSGHDGDLLEVMDHAIGIPQFSVILCRYNFLQFPDQPELFRRAREKGFACVAMKTLAGARGQDLAAFRDRHATFKQAALKWVLSNPDLANLVVSINATDQVDEYVRASGTPMSDEERTALVDYERLFGRSVCRMCDACEPACPAGVRVADVLRHRMYEKEYGLTGTGRAWYAEQRPVVAACDGCSAPCVEACPHDLDIPGELRAAHSILAG